MSAEPNFGDPTKPIVTLYETYGSGAAYVGRQLAARLSVPYFDQSYSSADLEKAEAAEEGGGWLDRLLRTIAASGTGLDSTSYQLYDALDDELVAHNNAGLIAEVTAGGVILGRNSTNVFARRPNSFHVKLVAPLQVRLDRAVRQDKITLQVARERQEREDRARVEMARRLYGWDPRASDNFDVVLNTGTYDLDTCVELILTCREAKLSAHSN